MNAIGLYRAGRWMYTHHIPLLPRFFKGIAFILFNSVVPYTSEIGSETKFAYGGIGCVIHSRAKIGDRVIIGQNTTIGRSLDPEDFPSIGNDVNSGKHTETFSEYRRRLMRLDNSSYEVLYPVIADMEDGVKPMNVCFLLTHVPNPRINKRIEVFKKTASTKVICTRRASQNIWEPSQDVEHIIFDVDLPSAKHIVKRFVVSQSFQNKALEKLEEIEPNIIYAEGLDPLIIAGKYKKKHTVKIIFEVADLRENYIVRPKKPVDRIITDALLKKEKKAFKNVDYLVVTSPKFYDMHYKDLISKERMLFIPNEPDTQVFENYHKKVDGPFTVGFIGGIRYLKQMKMLVDVANEVGCNVLFAGAGGTSTEYDEIRRYCEGMQNITFTGRYDYNTEIAGIYGKVDCVYAVYDADNPNVRIALPNKLYESILCELPIIVAKGTYLSELVEENNVGISVSHTDEKELEQALMKLKTDPAYREQIAENCRRCRKLFLDTRKTAEQLQSAADGGERHDSE